MLDEIAGVVAKAEEVLEGRPKFNHFMGALILAPGGDGFTIGSTPKVQVVDGQQQSTRAALWPKCRAPSPESASRALSLSGDTRGRAERESASDPHIVLDCRRERSMHAERSDGNVSWQSSSTRGYFSITHAISLAGGMRH